MSGLSPELRHLVDRVRAAVRAQPPGPDAPRDRALVRRVPRDAADLAVRFALEAEAAGMRVVRCADAALEAELVARAAGAGLVAVAVRDAALRDRVRATLSAADVRLAPDDDPDRLFDCAVGVTDVDAAIAETGSLVISTHGRMRNAWIAPPRHLAIVRAAQVLPDLVDLLEGDGDALAAASATIVTGPSKTADIEGVLVTGVHGPGDVEILLVE